MLTHVRRRTALEVLLVLVLIAATVIAVVEHQRPASRPTVGAAYIPPEQVLGLTNVRGVVSSAYAYEASLLDYSPPVADSDFILGYGVSEPVHLPGGSWDKYQLVRIVYVAGSGYVEEWKILTGPDAGSRFAFLHLIRYTVTAGVAAYAGPPLGPKTDDNTVYGAVKAALPVGATANPGVYSGGKVVAYSGWPTDPAYGNGLGGPQNAQLCLLYDAGSAGWFFDVAVGYDHKPKPKPKPFNARGWNAWRVSHHKPLIPYKVHGKLTPIAAHWQNGHQSCYGVTGKQVWHAKQGYEQEYFSRCRALYWPKMKGLPVKFTSGTTYTGTADGGDGTYTLALTGNVITLSRAGVTLLTVTEPSGDPTSGIRLRLHPSTGETWTWTGTPS